MTEILTESFCERCGTRYTFESARPKTRLKGVKVLSRGLKNFVLSDDTSMDEAMAAARSETDREASAHQLDAFHKTFSFCMSCRQYTCPNCWNDAEARCLSCAPLALPEPPAIAETEPFMVGTATAILPEALLPAAETPQAATEAPAAATEGPSEPEPYDDLRALRDALLVGDAEAEPTNGAYAEADETAPAAFATIDIEAIDADSAADAQADAEAAARAAAETDLAAEPDLATVEAELAAAEPEAASFEASEAEPVADVEAETAVEPEATAEAEPVAAPAAESEEEIAAAAASPVPDDAAGKAASQTLGLLRRFRPGQSLDAELAAFEREREETFVAAETPTDELAAAEQVDAPLPVAEAAEAEAVIEAPLAPDAAPVAAEEQPALAVEEQPEAAPVAETEPALAAPDEPEAPPVAAEAQLEPAPTTAQPEPEPATAAEPETAPVAATADDVVEQPTWRITAPDLTPSTTPPPSPEAGGQVPLQASASPRDLPKGEPQWPARPEWPSASTPAAGLPYLGRPATPQGGIEALWAASSQEVVSAPQPAGKAAANSIQPCVSCGLSLSATARFCRRCGTLQGR